MNSPYFENMKIGIPNYEMLYEILESLDGNVVLKK